MYLSIELEHESMCLCTDESSITGHLLLTFDSSDELNFRHYSASIRLTGKEKIMACSDDITILDETWRLVECQLIQKSCMIFPFDLPLPRDLPISFLEDEGSIEYSLTATFRDLNQYTLRSMHYPLTLIPPTLSSSSSLSSLSSQSSLYTSRLFWGMSEQAQWQYELEVPQVIDTTRPIMLNLRTRLRGFFFPRKNPSPMESCLIGVKLFESIKAGSYSGSYRILMTTSRVLSQPSSTWSSPCTFSFEMDQSPLSSTVCGTQIKVTHHLQITLNYCSGRGESDRLVLDCIVPLFGVATIDQKTESDWLQVNDTYL